ncbi:MAG: hypothetical protein FWG51_03325 [Firmicutes bacterium]|nr:hypothetical protein [Bacillota bacterium]
MKKVSCIFLFMLIVTVMAGCSGNPYLNNVSEIRENIFAGNSDNFNVSVFAGEREKPYKADGIAEKRTSYFLVVVEPEFEADSDEVLNVSFKINNDDFSKSITKDIFRDKFIFDFGKVNAKGSFTINLKIGLYDEDITMNDLSADLTKTYLQALEEGMALLQEKYQGTLNSGKYACEIYVKLCYKKFMNTEKLYWYVAILDTKGNISSVTFDAS